jgi:glutamyl-tRNA(Gln) amidotransferase subunit D
MSSAKANKQVDRYRGYRGRAKALLQANEAGVWGLVKMKTTRGDFEGLILPRSETFDDLHIVLKLDSGYNIGVHVDTVESIVESGIREADYHIPEREIPRNDALPEVKLFGTGGTIASRLDYRTGAVIPSFSPGELYGAVPELADICNLDTEKLYSVFSENMSKDQYIGTAKRIGEAIADGYAGVVIGHGTDTMHHTASVLSYMVQDSPIPIIMVGSQRSSDRPSSDAALNLIHGVSAAAYGDIAEVMVCMFGPTSDEYGLLHRGTRVRKMHSSYRSTFRTIGDIPVAMVNKDDIIPLRDDYARRRDDRNVSIHAHFEDRVTMLWFYPGMDPAIMKATVDLGYRGIVIGGTGLGHVNRPMYEALKYAQDRGVHVYMTVQTLWGYVQMYVYETGREMLDLGVIPSANMLPEAAFMKLSWVLGKTDDRDEVRDMMLTPIASEITEREPHDGYLIYQGGIPEVEEFIAKHRK